MSWQGRGQVQNVEGGKGKERLLWIKNMNFREVNIFIGKFDLKIFLF